MTNTVFTTFLLDDTQKLLVFRVHQISEIDESFIKKIYRSTLVAWSEIRMAELLHKIGVTGAQREGLNSPKPKPSTSKTVKNTKYAPAICQDETESIHSKTVHK